MRTADELEDVRPTHAQIGRCLAEARRAAQMSQTAAATALGMSQSRLARLETGARRLLFLDALRIAELYGVTLASLVPPITVARTGADPETRT